MSGGDLEQPTRPAYLNQRIDQLGIWLGWSYISQLAMLHTAELETQILMSGYGKQ